MISKTFIETEGKLIARVTFTLSQRIWADTISLVGDFNDWNRSSHPFGRDREGRWTLTIDLLPGRAYQFRYLCDGAWMGDNQADAYVHHAANLDNFVVVTDPNFRGYYDEKRTNMSKNREEKRH